MNRSNVFQLMAVSAISSVLIGCGGSANNTDTNTTTDDREISADTALTIPSTYTFESVFSAGESSVSYTGQTKRHLLIDDLVQAILDLQDSVGQGVRGDLDFYYRFDASSSDGQTYLFSLDTISTIPSPTYGDVASGKSLVGKTAGNDKAEHILGDGFIGWETWHSSLTVSGSGTPENLVDHFFAVLDDLASDGITDEIAITGGTVGIDVPYVSKAGVDYRQMVQKFLLGAVAYSQGAADYLKTDFSTGNDAAAAGKNYSFAQHKWDEAFGYFGAARNYNDYTDDAIAGKSGATDPEFGNGYNDTDTDGSIDLRSEFNWGHSANCAKRDRGATVATDFTKEAFDAFLTGRAILNQSENLTDTEIQALQAAALTVSLTWEKCIAATVVHYINDTLADMDAFVGAAYADLDSFRDHAKHWSEMKGFALGLQFNPDSPFRADTAAVASLETVLRNMGDAPVLPDGTQNGVAYAGGVEAYRTALLEARDIMEDIYGFDAANVANW